MKSISDWFYPLVEVLLLVGLLALLASVLYVGASILPEPDVATGHTIGVFTNGRTFYFTKLELELHNFFSRGLLVWGAVVFVFVGSRMLASKLFRKTGRRS